MNFDHGSVSTRTKLARVATAVDIKLAFVALGVHTSVLSGSRGLDAK